MKKTVFLLLIGTLVCLLAGYIIASNYWGSATLQLSHFFILFFIALLLVVFIIFILLKTRRYIASSSTDRLVSLPYHAWISAENSINKVGVTLNNHDRSYKGLNIYTHEDFSTAYLIDMSGKILHTWSEPSSRWEHVEMCGNGDLLGIGIARNHRLVKLDWDSNVRWVKRMRFHHDIAIAENNDIYAIVQKRRVVFDFGFPKFIYDEYISILTQDGEIKRQLSLLKILKKDIPRNEISFVRVIKENIGWLVNREIIQKPGLQRKFIERMKKFYDIFHVNTIEIIDRDIGGLCKKGDLLICVRTLNIVGILDIKRERLIWSWGPGNLDWPHHPTLLENGNILVFDNGFYRGYSRIIELDPITKTIVWEYKSSPPDQFYSSSRGSSQRLPNGNTLITESDKGHVFEITHDGEIVWEFYSTEINKEDKTRRAIYRMMRIDPKNYPFLKDLK
jgi:hypothetical protein